MPGIARVQGQMIVSGPDGNVSIDKHAADAVTNWVGPYVIQIPTGTDVQMLLILGVQGLTFITNFWITSDQDIAVTYGSESSNEGITLKAGGFHLLGKTTLTAVALTNASGMTANVTYYAAGV